ncbi:MAG TPA: metalloregulator ArsR/SmtB family transcription factor [Candidatus Dormibacteraeota bacterium]|nr:metalloregulator ArsR/SmtB family transcription factor [Candidatus Dormibacteraeota bacterium]
MAAERGKDGGPVWSALSDPTRRRVLDLLRESPRTTGDIASHFEISRIAVMRHLQVLSAAGLVISRKHGRERWHYLDAVPLQKMYERWVNTYAAGWASGLLRLGRRVEGRGHHMSANPLAVDVAMEVSIAAARSDVFAALTKDPAGWWGHPYLRADATALTLERRLGGLVVESWPGGGAVLATVTGWSDDRYLQLTGPFHLGVAVGVATFDLSDRDEVTSLQFSFRAFGAIEPELIDRFKEGWTELVGRRLKTLVEKGIRLGIAPDAPDKEARR